MEGKECQTAPINGGGNQNSAGCGNHLEKGGVRKRSKG